MIQGLNKDLELKEVVSIIIIIIIIIIIN